MSDTAAALEKRALDCERKAAITTDETLRRSVLGIAQAWREISADYEELSRKQAENKSQPDADG